MIPSFLKADGTIENGLRLCSGHNERNWFFIRDSEKPAGFSESPFHGRGRKGKRHLQRRFLRKRSAAGKVCTGFQRAEPSQLRCAQHGTMRSISARNSRFFVSTCDNSSLSADRLIYLFISVLYHFCGYIAIVRYCLSLQFCLLPFR